MKRNNGPARLLALLLCLLLAGCGMGEAETSGLFSPAPPPAGMEEGPAPTVILLTLSDREDSYSHQCAVKFKQVLEQRSEGAFLVEVFPGNTLGTLYTADNMLYNGSVEMRLGPGPSNLLQLLSVPALSGMTAEELPALMQSAPWRELLQEECAAYNVEVLGILPATYRIVSSDREIYSVGQLGEMRVRYAGIPLSQVFWSTLDCKLVEIPIDNSYAAMQNQLVEANVDNTLLNILMYNIYRQQPYLILTNHQIYLESFYVHSPFFDSLEPEEQALLRGAVDETVRWAQPLLEQLLRQGRAEVEAAGGVLIPLEPEERAVMDALTYEPVLAYMQEQVSPGVLERAMTLLEARG